MQYNQDTLDQMLVDAVIKGDANLVRHLLSQSAHVDAMSFEDGNTALHWSALKGNVEITKLLLASGADVTAKNKQNVTPIQLAASKNNGLCVAAIVNHQSADNEDKGNYGAALLFAARANQTELVLMLLQAKAPIIWRMKDTYDTCLHWAARNKNKQLVTALILSGADVNKKNNSGITPLHIAAKNGDTALALLLLQNDASLSEMSNTGHNPVDVAIKECHFECAREMQLFQKINSLPENVKEFFYEMTLGTLLTNPVITPQGSTYQYDKLIQFGSDPQTRAVLTKDTLLHNNIVEALVDHYARPGVDVKTLPDCLRCSLSKNIFVDPVVATDGDTYERKNIESYLKEHNGVTPTGSWQNNKALYPNRFVADLIENNYSDLLKSVISNTVASTQYTSDKVKFSYH